MIFAATSLPIIMEIVFRPRGEKYQANLILEAATLVIGKFCKYLNIKQGGLRSKNMFHKSWEAISDQFEPLKMFSWGN